MLKTTRTAALLAALICTAPPVFAATPGEFYASLLRRGVAAFEAGRLDEATQHLRLAAFGFIENIELYQTAHAYLAATYERRGEPDRALDSVRRIAQAERIQARFAALKIPDGIRATVEKLATGVLTPAELAGLRGAAAMPPRASTQPATRTTTTTTTNPPVTVDRVEVEEIKQAPPAQTTAGTNHEPLPATATPPPNTSATTAPATPAQATTTPATTTGATATPSTTVQNPPPATTTPATTPSTAARGTTTQPAVPQPAQPRVAPPPAPPAAATTTTTTTTATPPRPAPVYTAAEQAVRFAAAERALNANDLPEARRIYSELLASQGLDRSSYIRLAEGFYRARHFTGALAAFERAGGLRGGEEPYRYYVAVALYETGQYERASRELASALPYIEITPDVARYRLKIQSAIQ